MSHADPKLTERINNDFCYHRPPTEVAADFVRLREQAKSLAHLINELVPDGREKSLAITNLEQTTMWANAGIARQFPAS
ncbi:MAG: hypothetical protein GC208_10530 [Alphaproteobacteria bacterium]|nr:hypothetical protein [Alphaproteobacteria bacterium]